MDMLDFGVFADDWLTVSTFGWFETHVVPDPVGAHGWNRGKGRGKQSDVRTFRAIENASRTFRPTTNRSRRGS